MYPITIIKDLRDVCSRNCQIASNIAYLVHASSFQITEETCRQALEYCKCTEEEFTKCLDKYSEIMDEKHSCQKTILRKITVYQKSYKIIFRQESQYRKNRQSKTKIFFVVTAGRPLADPEDILKAKKQKLNVKIYPSLVKDPFLSTFL